MDQKRNTRTPEHYDVPIQPIAYILANNLTFPEGNVVKYITRHRFKGEDKDIYKKSDMPCIFSGTNMPKQRRTCRTRSAR